MFKRKMMKCDNPLCENGCLSTAPSHCDGKCNKCPKKCPDCHGTGTKPEPEHTSICCNVGEHKCDLIMDLPDHMSDYREAREKAGLSPQICIDKCLENDIKRLWMLGYRTVNSCCGHGKTNSTVIIEFERMQNGKTI